MKTNIQRKIDNLQVKLDENRFRRILEGNFDF